MDNREQIEEIKSKLDIATLVQHYVPSLKRTGRNYFGLCPFHQEKTPSFSVNSEIGVFKCFGCGEGGDVIKFLEKIEGLDFSKALELAAEKAGVKLVRRFRPEDAKKQAEKEKLLEANHLTAEYYHYILSEHSMGIPGRTYAERRKLSKIQIDKFLIGYAPKAYENLKNFLIKKGFNLSDLVRWGLLVEKNGKIYDKFRDRLMFTITDHQGDVVGFSGRLIDPDGLGPKYLNSSETLVYKKSKILFGLFQAKEAIRKEKFVILVEGNVDLLSSHEAGVSNIVAPMGTALTPEQLTLIKRYCEKVYFALDTDNAGQKALQKDLALVGAQNMQAFVLDIGAFKDVDDLIVAGGDWAEVVSKPQEVVPYFMKLLKVKYDLSKSFEKNSYVKQILELIIEVPDRIIQTDYLKKLELTTGIDIRILLQEMQSLSSNKTLNNFKKIDAVSVSGLPSGSAEIRDNFGGHIKELDLLCRYLLALIIEHKSYQAEIKASIKIEQLPSSIYQNLFQGIWDSKFAKNLSPSEQSIFADINLMSVTHFNSWEELVKEMHQVQKRIRREQIREELEALRLVQDSVPDNKEYLQRLKELTTELSKLKTA